MRGSGWCPFFNNWHERDARASEGQSVVYEVMLVKLNGTKEVEHNIDIIEIGADKTLQKA